MTKYHHEKYRFIKGVFYSFIQNNRNKRRRHLIAATPETLKINPAKRIFDIAAASAGLTLLAPVLGVVAYQVKRNLGSPVLFRQTRPGLNGQPFEMIKFRSMTEATDANGVLLSNAERLTPFGQWLRSTSLDELPELWNVLKGDMSLVGPRPLLMAYLPRYSSEQARRHLLRPGITGLAQVNGRNGITWEEKFALDTWYVDYQSLWLDIKILCKTVTQVLNKDNINASPDTIMPKFYSHQSSPPPCEQVDPQKRHRSEGTYPDNAPSKPKHNLVDAKDSCRAQEHDNEQN